MPCFDQDSPYNHKFNISSDAVHTQMPKRFHMVLYSMLDYLVNVRSCHFYANCFKSMTSSASVVTDVLNLSSDWWSK